MKTACKACGAVKAHRLSVDKTKILCENCTVEIPSTEALRALLLTKGMFRVEQQKSETSSTQQDNRKLTKASLPIRSDAAAPTVPTGLRPETESARARREQAMEKERQLRLKYDQLDPGFQQKVETVKQQTFSDGLAETNLSLDHADELLNDFFDPKTTTR
jgi:hypothetical protein